MKNQLENFKNTAMVEGSLSNCTLQAYETDIVKFINFLPEEKAWNAVTQKNVIDFLGVMHSHGYANATITRTFHSLKSFFKYLLKNDLVDKDPTQFIQRKNNCTKIPDVLTIPEVQAMMFHASIDNSAARDVALLELLYSNGLRVSELCAIKLSDIQGDSIRIHGKGNKERIVPLTVKTKLAIQKYIDSIENRPSDLLFLNRVGKPLDRVAAYRIVKKHSFNAGIMKSVSPHTLRHSLATHLLDRGADIRVIQAILGHSDIRSTAHYSQVSTHLIKQAFNEYHPNIEA